MRTTRPIQASSDDLITTITYLLTYLLMELSPSGVASNSAATQELPNILWSPCPKEPTTGPYPGSDQSYQYHLILSL
jgi:hypothetical protein